MAPIQFLRSKRSEVRYVVTFPPFSDWLGHFAQWLLETGICLFLWPLRLLF